MMLLNSHLLLRRGFEISLAIIFSLTLLCTGFIGTASALGTILPGQYTLLDHPDGQLNPPPYGLRYDDLGLLFSTELGAANVILDWDGGATASITGTLYENGTGDIWTVVYNLSGVVAAGGNLGFTASGGTGTLTDPVFNNYALTGEVNGSGNAFEFLADGHRLAGDNDTAVGRGWLLPPSSTDDWLVQAVPVPEPGTALLMGMGIALLAGRRGRI